MPRLIGSSLRNSAAVCSALDGAEGIRRVDAIGVRLQIDEARRRGQRRVQARADVVVPREAAPVAVVQQLEARLELQLLAQVG